LFWFRNTNIQRERLFFKPPGSYTTFDYNSKYVDEYVTKEKILTKEELDKINQIVNFFSYEEVKKKLYTEKRIKHSVDQVYNWFIENYDDPANGVPYSSSEGGYQYWNGGPYDPNDEIQAHYPHIDQDVLKEVLDKIYAFGSEWVKKGEY
jgi:hypothetical protein